MNENNDLPISPPETETNTVAGSAVAESDNMNADSGSVNSNTATVSSDVNTAGNSAVAAAEQTANIQSTLPDTGSITSGLPETIKAPDSNGSDDIPLLQLVNVVKRYGSKTVLKSLSFSIGRGGIIGLLGPNGSGKTTIIKLINRLLVPNSGQILLNGRPVDVDSASVISYLPERSYLPLGDRVCDIIDYFSDFYSDFDRRKAYEMLTRLKINSRDRIRTLSKGTREKVQLMLVMSRRAQLYILDEPIGGVDPAARDFILDTILGNYHEDGSIIISTHLISDIERILDDVIFISDGQAMLCASVESIHTKHQKTVDELFREVYRC